MNFIVILPNYQGPPGVSGVPGLSGIKGDRVSFRKGFFKSMCLNIMLIIVSDTYFSRKISLYTCSLFDQ